eukprot:COSAG03_NODE_22_length_20538_cov_27.667286_3_plen_174_part_00
MTTWREAFTKTRLSDYRDSDARGARQYHLVIAQRGSRAGDGEAHPGAGGSLHDTVLKRYRVAAGSARPLRDYHLMHDSSFIHDYRLPRDPSYSTILPSFTTTSALAIPLWKSLPESRAAPTIPPWKSLPESPPAPTHRVPSRPNFTPVAAPPTRHTRSRGGLIRTAIRFRADW